ncbi:ribonuclease P protein component [Bacteroidota bacterium]
MATKYTFGNQERLKSSLTIQDLLKSGKVVSEFPLKIYWSISTDPQQNFPARVAISVPKRKFKKAVDRNLMKRRIRESYRQNKDLIYDPLRQKKLNVELIILFLSDEFISFDGLNISIRKLLQKLANNLPQ